MKKFKFWKIFIGVFVLTFFAAIFLNSFVTVKDSKVLFFNNHNIKPNIDNPSSSEAIVSLTPSQTSTPTASPSANPTKVDYIKFPISKTNSVGQYIPENLVNLNPSLTTKSVRVRSEIVSDLTKLIQAAKSEGITLKVVSGYRSYGDQSVIFNNYVNQELRTNPNLTKQQAEAKANTYSAKPGHSEHQLGTTVDILSDEVNYQFDSNPNTKFAKWLEANSTKHNFEISYPQGNSEYIYEPWHLRWSVN